MTRTTQNIPTVVVRYLEDLASQLSRFDLSKPFTAIKLEESISPKIDILEQIVSSFNDIQKRACLAYNEKELLNQSIDHEPLVKKNAISRETTSEQDLQNQQINAEKLALRQRKSVLKTDHWLDEQLGFTGGE